MSKWLCVWLGEWLDLPPVHLLNSSRELAAETTADIGTATSAALFATCEWPSPPAPVAAVVVAVAAAVVVLSLLLCCCPSVLLGEWFRSLPPPPPAPLLG